MILQAHNRHSPAASADFDPAEWRSRLEQYRIAKALNDADCAFGPLRDATAAFELDQMRRGARPGEPASPAAQAGWQALETAEALHQKQYTEPFWRAARALVMTPAPTAEALTLKVAIIKDEEVWNDGQLPGEAMDYVLADARRLSEARG